MANLETIVRPFQLPDNAPSQKYLTAKQAGNPPIMLYFGRTGSGRTFSGSSSVRRTYYMDQAVVEKAISNNPWIGVWDQLNQAINDAIPRYIM